MKSKLDAGSFCLCLTLLFSWVCTAVAQQQEVRFRHIANRDGLSQNTIATILQDQKGYIWVGSWSGLARYDGTNFTAFRQSDTVANSISHNRINRIYEDKKGCLWVATGGGLNLFDRKTESFKRIGLTPGKGGANFISALQEDSFGNFWVSTYKGLKIYNPANQQLKSVRAWDNAKGREFYEGISFSLLEDREKKIWVGAKKGLRRFDPKSQKILPLPKTLSQNTALSSARIVVIRQSKTGELWFGTEEDGLFRYDPDKDQCTRYVNNEADALSLPSNWINDIIFRNGEVWIATKNGLALLDPKLNTFTNYHHDSADAKSISDDSVWSLMQDNTGNLWIGSYAGGINIFYPGNANFTNISERIGNNMGLNKPLASCVLEDSKGALWVGTFGGGLNYLDRNRSVARYYSVKDLASHKVSNEVRSLMQGDANELWVGTIDGLCKFDKHTGRVKYVALQMPNGKTGAKLINALLKDKEGLWVGTNGNGLKFVNRSGRETKSFYAQSPSKYSLSDNYINALAKDGNYLWIGTQNGLNQYNVTTNRFEVFSRKNYRKISNDNILTLLKDTYGHLWMGTDGGGLNCLDLSTNGICTIKRVDGLVDDVISKIIEDASGNLWVSTTNGLSKITFRKHNFPFNRLNYQIENYTTANGLSGNEFLSNSGIRTQNGELLFGGINGITAFRPDRIVKNIYKPAVLFTEFAIKNKALDFGTGSPLQNPVNETKTIRLSYDENNLSVKFSALNFINPDKNTYAYKMIGLNSDKEWTNIGNQKEVSFVNLDPGKYVFYVKAANNDGVWNNQARTIAIEIMPPWWRTWWAYLLYVVTLTSVSFKIIQFFQIRSKLESDLRNEHLQYQRQQEFYKMKMDFFTGISHEIRTPLTLILGPVENLYKNTQGDTALNKQIYQIKNNAERLLRLIGELMDFRKAESGNMVLYLRKNDFLAFIKEIYLSFQPLADSRQINYQFTTGLHEIYIHSDKDQLEKVFFNLLSNAFKFTPDGGQISIDVSLMGETDLAVVITDNGKGIPLVYQQKLFTNFYQVQPDQSQSGTGVGLALSKSIVELHQGKIFVESRQALPGSSGRTAFTVHIPLNGTEADNVHIIAEDIDPENLVTYKLQSQIDVLEAKNAGEYAEDYTLLLVEDNEELRNFIAESLSGYHVLTATNGHEGYENAVAQIPDLIISDVMMPVMDGLEFCRKVKTDERTSHIPVILLTALAAPIHQVNGLQFGADSYLTKPFSTTLLKLQVRNLISARETMRQKFSQQVLLQPQSLPVTSADEQFLNKLMRVVEEHMEDPEFGVPSLQSEIGMSKSVLYRKIKALTDLSPSDFIKSMRLKKAAFLLTQNVFTVNEISAMVGFNDRKYFSREFKKLFGKSPSEIIVVIK